MFASPEAWHVATDPAFIKQHLPVLRRHIRQLEKGGMHFDTFAACGFGSIPWVIELSRVLKVPYVMVRKKGEKTSNPDASMIVGRFGPKRHCVFVDDTIWLGRTCEHVKATLANVNAPLVTVVELCSVFSGFYDLANAHRREVSQRVNDPTFSTSDISQIPAVP